MSTNEPPRQTRIQPDHRKKRDQLTTANARAEKRDARPLTYDPFRVDAPLQPQTYMSTSAFKYDDFVGNRRYARRNLHGDADNRFDADFHEPPATYKAHLEAQPLDGLTDEDGAIEAEKEANLIAQPPEAIASLRQDLANKNFIHAIKGPVTRSTAPSRELERKQQLVEQAAAQTRQIETAFTKARDQDPDFFTHLSGYELIRRRISQNKDNDKALLEAIERELQALATRGTEDDDLIDEDELARQRAALEAERDEIKRLAATEVAETGEMQEPDESQVAQIGDAEARQLLEPAPLLALHVTMRVQFLQLSEPAQIWRLLYPLVCQHETHRRHYNIVELVRAMSLRGAKYDGCVKVRTKRRLGPLLDRKFFGSFIDKTTGNLVGEHEHWHQGWTTFVVFKFYLVRRNKANTEVLNKKAADTANASTSSKVAPPTDLTDEATNNMENRFDAQKRHMLLNKAGLYDSERRGDDEDDGTDEYGSMHDIKYLDKENMFSMRLVCVEAQPSEEAEGYASMDDNDYELPAELHLSEQGGAQSVWSINDKQRSSSQPSGTNTSSARPSRSADAAASDDGDAFDEDKVEDPAFVHSDDDDDEERDAHKRAAATMQFMPQDSVVLTLEQAQHLVGKWRAEAFMHRVNSHTIGTLCVRSFMFYAAGGQK